MLLDRFGFNHSSENKSQACYGGALGAIFMLNKKKASSVFSDFSPSSGNFNKYPQKEVLDI